MSKRKEKECNTIKKYLLYKFEFFRAITETFQIKPCFSNIIITQCRWSKKGIFFGIYFNLSSMLDTIEKSLQRITFVHRQQVLFFFAVCSKTVSITACFNKKMSSENCSVLSISFLRGLYFLLNSSPILLGSLWTARKMMPKLFPSCSSAFLIESAWKM